MPGNRQFTKFKMPADNNVPRCTYCTRIPNITRDLNMTDKDDVCHRLEELKLKNVMNDVNFANMALF